MANPSLLSEIAQSVRAEPRKPLLSEAFRGESREMKYPDVEPAAAEPAPAPQRKRKKDPIGKDRWSDPKYLEDVGSRLASKALTGAGVPGEGVIPFAQVHTGYAQMVQGAQQEPVVGWDPKALNDDEMQLLLRLMGAAKVEREAPGGIGDRNRMTERALLAKRQQGAM